MLKQKFPEGNPMEPIIEEEETINVRLINSRVVAKNKCDGYCRNYQHIGYLNKTLIKEHQCNEKICPFFYEIIKEKSMVSTSKAIASKKLKKLTDFDKEIVEKLKKYKHKDYECLVIDNVISVEIGEKYIVYYAMPFANDKDEEKIAEDIENKIHVRVELIKIDYPYI